MKLLKTEDTSTAALDYIFRGLIPYIRVLNEENDNRKRTAVENGHYFIYEPNSKVLVRNVIAARIVPQKYYRLVMSACFLESSTARLRPSLSNSST